MIASLADAWAWYEGVLELTLAMQALDTKHGEILPWEGDLGRDNRLRYLEATTIQGRAEAVLRDLNDLGILLLFSVFEAIVRGRLLGDVERELLLLKHPSLKHAASTARETIEHGSFFRVLDPLKELDADLIEQINQVRQYRNWVAHGRRGKPANNLDPRTAYDRLQKFIERLDDVPAALV
jgi:hypothetical protein